MNYKTIEELEKDFKIVAYGTMGVPFRWCEMHLVKIEDLDKTKPCKKSNLKRKFKKVLPIRTKNAPSLEVLLKHANSYKPLN